MACRHVRLYIGPMRVPFRKMHGCGNDFVVFDERSGALGFTPARAAALADRRTGIGCDQFITIEPPPSGSNADAFMRIRNPDGSEAGACGNATRCVASMLSTETGRARQVIRTVAGNLPADVLPDGRVQVDMGPARLDWPDIPLSRPMDTLHLDLALGAVADPAAASMGNPHATFFVAGPRHPADRLARPGPGARRAVPGTRQYRLRPSAGAGPHPAASLGTRRGPDARPAAPAPALPWSTRTAEA